MREPFIEGCMANGVQRTAADEIFDDYLRFGDYAFNRPTPPVTPWCLQDAYMKVYYPTEYMAAC